ncbi:MAG: hypothetical protein ACC656_00865, partial [Candidatus Heimdallarchaeota archaeon]
MAKLSFLSFLKRAGIGSESIVMTNLDIPSKGKSKDKSDDFSTYPLINLDFSSPKLKVENPSKPQIPIIGVGG